MNRLKFMQGLRVEAFLSPKSRPKVDKDARKFVQLFFVVKMNANYALACDGIIQRAWEDCEDLERGIGSVALRVDVPNTDLDVYELRDSKEPIIRLENLTIDGLGCERKEGVTYLYFCVDVPQHRGGFWRWYGAFYNHTLFIEFKPSQFALTGVVEKVASDPEFMDAMARMVNPVAKGEGITSMSLQVEGMEPVVIDQEAAKRIQAAANSTLDELYDDAVKLVIEFGKASTSMLQRRLRIGYGRAANLLDMMEQAGIVGPADGPSPRAVLKTTEGAKE